MAPLDTGKPNLTGHLHGCRACYVDGHIIGDSLKACAANQGTQITVRPGTPCKN